MGVYGAPVCYDTDFVRERRLRIKSNVTVQYNGSKNFLEKEKKIQDKKKSTKSSIILRVRSIKRSLEIEWSFGAEMDDLVKKKKFV